MLWKGNNQDFSPSIVKFVPKNQVDVTENRVLGKTLGQQKGHVQVRLTGKPGSSFLLLF